MLKLVISTNKKKTKLSVYEIKMCRQYFYIKFSAFKIFSIQIRLNGWCHKKSAPVTGSPAMLDHKLPSSVFQHGK